jgi:hypothetical protein
LQAPQARDPQAEALASYLPMSAERIGKMLPLLPSLLIEFIPMAAMLLATVLWSSATGPAPEPEAGVTPAAVTADELHAGTAKEKETLQRITVLVLNSQDGRLVTPSARRLANYLEVKPSTFAEWVDKWREKGLIKAVRQGTSTIFMLPNYSTDKDE